MSDIVLLYLFTRLDTIGGIAFVAMLGAGVTVVWSLVYSWGKRDMAEVWENCPNAPEYKTRIAAANAARRIIRPALIAWALAAGVVMVTPSKQDMAIIVGGKIALDASRTDTAKEISQEVLDAIRAQLKKAKE